MDGPIAALIGDGGRLHLQHGPIDLIIAADPAEPGGRRAAFAAAADRFDTLLGELVEELPLLRSPLTPTSDLPKGRVARRMDKAVRPHSGAGFVTLMAAVAGAVADEILAAMLEACPLSRAYVNNGGDIALHLDKGWSFRSAMAGLDGADLGRIDIAHGAGVGGVATSGQGGRSLSFGIADSVTVLAGSAAAADVAATLIANAVTLPDHPRIRRRPASELQPDSDLGDRLVVTHVGQLDEAEVARALDAGAEVAAQMHRHGLIAAACLSLGGATRLAGATRSLIPGDKKKVAHV